MRNLREKLMAVASKPPAPKAAPPAKPDAFFSREHVFSLDDLQGIEKTTLDEIRSIDPLFAGESWDIRHVLFLDTETTGLSGGAGTVAFEIGIGFVEADHFVVRQYVMRDYSEEASMLTEIERLIRRFDTLVTFNGKSFDLPLLESRMILSRIRLPVTQMPHLDLLHAARRVYKLRLRRCNLASLEEAVLGQSRSDDLPGAQVPQRYFDYIKTKQFDLLEDVLRHNLDDVKSLASLTGHLCRIFSAPQTLCHPEDIFGIGKTLMKGGKKERARACFRIIGHSSMSSQAHMHLASSYKKDRDWAQAVASYQSMIAGGVGGAWPYIELAKYYEHILKDVPAALRCAQGALNHALNTALIGSSDENAIESIHKRINRLKRKQLQALKQRQED